MTDHKTTKFQQLFSINILSTEIRWQNDIKFVTIIFGEKMFSGRAHFSPLSLILNGRLDVIDFIVLL